MGNVSEPTVISPDLIRAVPKVLLHDHLDGGLRPATIVELARDAGHTLPEDDAESLGRWFTESADSGSLERYLETFDHTVAVMQRADHITRVARECVEDLAADGVVYAEVRYAPEQHLEGGLTLEEVVRAVQDGLRRGDGRERSRPADRRTPAADRHAPPGAVARDRRAGRQAPRRRGGRLRHRRCGGGLPAHPAPRRLRVPPARERPLHHPRRRGVRAAVDLAGDPVVRRRPARPRRPDHRRHHRRGRRGRSSAGSPSTSATSGSRSSCARTPTSRPAPPTRSPSTRSACSRGCASASRSTPTTG